MSALTNNDVAWYQINERVRRLQDMQELYHTGQTPTTGSHLYVWRYGVYSHHGIYGLLRIITEYEDIKHLIPFKYQQNFNDNDNIVIHLTVHATTGAMVEMIKLEDFWGANQIKIVKYETDPGLYNLKRGGVCS
eukprot:153569_1